MRRRLGQQVRKSFLEKTAVKLACYFVLRFVFRCHSEEFLGLMRRLAPSVTEPVECPVAPDGIAFFVSPS